VLGEVGEGDLAGELDGGISLLGVPFVHGVGSQCDGVLNLFHGS
jgi:hypothetical protein